MKVILLQDIKNIGKKWEVKEVSNGFAINFLLPKKMVAMATDSALKKSEKEKTNIVEKEKDDLEKNQLLAENLQGKELLIKAKEKEGKLFGSISAKNIAKELARENFQIKEESIILSEPIKEIGEYDIRIELGHGLESFLKLVIESENEK